MIGADLVEVAPPYDHSAITALAGATLAQDFLCLFAVRHHRQAVKRIERMIELVGNSKDPLQPAEFVEACLDALGCIDLGERSKSVLIDHACQIGSFAYANPGSVERTVEMFQLIVSTPDYQYC